MSNRTPQITPARKNRFICLLIMCGLTMTAMCSQAETASSTESRRENIQQHMLENTSQKLNLDDNQKLLLNGLLQNMLPQPKTEDGSHLWRKSLQVLVENDYFDELQAQAIADAGIAARQQRYTRMIKDAAAFFNSLNTTQKAQARNWLADFTQDAHWERKSTPAPQVPQ